MLVANPSFAKNWCNDSSNRGCWLMENSGTETDNGANTSGDMLLLGSTTIPTSTTVPKIYTSNSRDFERDEADYLYHADGLGTDISGANAQMTIVAWIRLESVGGGNYAIFCKYLTTGDNRQYCFWVDSTSDQLEFFKSDTSASGVGFDSVLGSTSLTTNTWYHVAAVYDDTEMTVYLDGVEDATPLAETGGIYNGTAQVRIGSSPSQAGNEFDGLIDEVAIFNTALTQSQIQDIMNNGLLQNKTFIRNATIRNATIR